ncbi:MAG: diguanylate cyclase [Erythrobacter sp.]
MSREFASPDFALREEIDTALAQGVDYEAWSPALKAKQSEHEQARGYSLLRHHILIVSLLSLASLAWDMVAVPQLAELAVGWRLVTTLPLALYGLLVLRQGDTLQLKLVLGVLLISLGTLPMHLASHGDPEVMVRYTMASSFILGLACLAAPFNLREMRIFALSFLLATSVAALWPDPLPNRQIALYISFSTLICLPALAIARRHWQLGSRAFLLDMRDSFSRLELEQSNLLLQQLSEQDPLTGMPNRRKFERVMAEKMDALPASHSSHGHLAVMMIDLDHFKAFNDRHGHQAGDRCLVLAAAQLQALFPSSYGILARYGGEEFIAALREREPGEAARLAEDMRAAIAAMLVPVRDEAKPLITTSIGLALAPGDARLDLDDLIEMADVALYSAKRAGRDRVETVEAGEPAVATAGASPERRRG